MWLTPAKYILPTSRMAYMMGVFVAESYQHH
ncbi:MAG: hypothetical protein HJJLKODD_02100 [Phycisphaerae bacterium]|nr:hypothetical protein [Phycisphaerae bacterium]